MTFTMVRDTLTVITVFVYRINMTNSHWEVLFLGTKKSTYKFKKLKFNYFSCVCVNDSSDCIVILLKAILRDFCVIQKPFFCDTHC